MQTTWSQIVPPAEGSYLEAEDLKQLESYALSFAKRRDIYHLIQHKEPEWITHVLQTMGHNPSGDLERPALLLAEQLARCLRLAAICFLTYDLDSLNHQEPGKMEDYLDLPQALRHLQGEMQISLAADEIALFNPFWQALMRIYQSDPEATEEISEHPLTVDELFV